MTELLAEVDENIYDISELANSVDFTDKLNDGCSKLEFTYNESDVKITNGCVVRFTYDDIKFYGRVFKREQSVKGIVSITAYDQLRYAKGNDTFLSKNDTVSTLVKKMCVYFNFNQGYIADILYKLKTTPVDNKAWLDIVYNAISDTLTNTGAWYALRDEYGSITLRNIDDLKLDLLLGDESICYNYSHAKSIDDEFYNIILIDIVSENAFENRITKNDTTSIAKYGPMQYYKSLSDKNYNEAQATQMATELLSLYNKEVETLQLDCIGDTRIRAGNSFLVNISETGVENTRLIVKSVAHSFIPTHTMSIEVKI